MIEQNIIRDGDCYIVGNERISASGVAEVPLADGSIALIDQVDDDAISKVSWSKTKPVYGKQYAHGHRPGFHRGVNCNMNNFLMCPPPGYEVDHINGVGLDNRRCNLRICVHQQNSQNMLPRTDGASKYKGVCCASNKKTWRAYIVKDNKQYGLGNYTSEIDAAVAYDDAATQMFSEYAKLNREFFPEVASAWKQHQENGTKPARSRRGTPGEKHHSARFTKEDVEVIRVRYAAKNVSVKELALIYGVSRSTITRMCRGRSWKS